MANDVLPDQRDQLKVQLEKLTARDGGGISYKSREPYSGSARLEIYGARAEALNWLLENAPAILALTSQPAGWKLVPERPTFVMEEAGVAALMSDKRKDAATSIAWAHAIFQDMWAAMLAAAPIHGQGEA